MALALALALLLAQAISSSGEWVPPVVNAAGSITVAGVLTWRLLRADKETEKLREEIAALHKLTLSVMERQAPLLSEATRTMDDVQEAMRAAVNRHDNSDPEDVVRRLERALSDLNRQRERGGR
jgi:hypothetical protein